MYQSMSALLHPGKPTTLGIQGAEYFQPSLDISDESSCISSPSSGQASARKFTSQFRLLILVSPCWLEAFLASHSSQCVGRHSLLVSILKDLVMDISVIWVLKGLPLLHLTLWHSEMCVVQTRFSSLVYQAVVGMTEVSTAKVYWKCWKEWTGQYAWEGVQYNATSAPKLANFLVNLFRVWLAWCTVGIYYSPILAFLETHYHHKPSNDPIISKLMCHVYSQCPFT